MLRERARRRLGAATSLFFSFVSMRGCKDPGAWHSPELGSWAGWCLRPSGGLSTPVVEGGEDTPRVDPMSPLGPALACRADPAGALAPAPLPASPGPRGGHTHFFELALLVQLVDVRQQGAPVCVLQLEDADQWLHETRGTLGKDADRTGLELFQP